MTVETTAIKAVAQGNGATTNWPFTFIIPEDDQVVLTLVDVDSGNPTVIGPAFYTVNGAGNPAGGSVDYPLSGSPVTSDYYVVVERVLPLTQESDLVNQGGAYPATIEEMCDYLTMVAQQLQDQINRAIVFSVADTVEVTLPTATARAGLFLGFDVNGDPIAVDGLTAGTTVSAAMIPVVTAPTTADALTALGIPGALLDALIPAGTVWDYIGTTAPSGFVLAFGQACTPIYPVLRAMLVAGGSPFGTNGVDPLMPDIRSRTVVGKSNMGGVDNGLFTNGTFMGNVSGVQSVTLTLATLPTGITSSNLGAIALTVNSTATTIRTPIADVADGAAAGYVRNGTIGTLTSTGTIAIGDADVTSNNTSGSAHENRQPSFILNKIIKAH
jgi:microcystin-dependent protein